MPVSISGDGAIDGLAFNSFGDVNIVSPQAGDKLVYDGSEWKNLVGYLYAGTRYYTSSGTFEKADPLGTGDIGLRAVRVRVVGGGGGSGNETFFVFGLPTVQQSIQMRTPSGLLTNEFFLA